MCIVISQCIWRNHDWGSEKTPGRGRAPTRPHTDARPISVKAYQESLGEKDWQEVSVRDTTKGVLTLRMHVKRVVGVGSRRTPGTLLDTRHQPQQGRPKTQI